jgi:mannose-6-phosphate isomerase-like protein (cupin superfamily)
MTSFRIVAIVALAGLIAALGNAVVSASADSQLELVELVQPVELFDAESVRAAFAKGAPLTETSSYKVHASRREAAGAAEIHADDTDIFYVLDGSAEVVTGGTMTAAKEVAPGELRADSIEGGVAREIEAGDVIVIPKGVPHWFRRVDRPIVYYVVKVTSLQ